MLLNLGQSAALWDDQVVGIFDLDNASWAVRTREFLKRAEERGAVEAVGDGLPRSFVVCPEKVVLCQLSPRALARRRTVF